MVIRMIKIQGIRGQNPGNGFWIRENPSPTGGAKSEGQNPGNGFWIRLKSPHPQGAKSGGQNPGNGFWTRKTTHPQGATSGGQNLGNGFWTRKTNHARGQNLGGKIGPKDLELGKPLTHQGAKSRGQNPGGKIRSAKSGQRIWNSEKPNTHLNNVENPQTQALFRE